MDHYRYNHRIFLPVRSSYLYPPIPSTGVKNILCSQVGGRPCGAARPSSFLICYKYRIFVRIISASFSNLISYSDHLHNWYTATVRGPSNVLDCGEWFWSYLQQQSATSSPGFCFDYFVVLPIMVWELFIGLFYTLYAPYCESVRCDDGGNWSIRI